MTGGARFSWVRVIVGVIAAEALPVLALVAVVLVYSLMRNADSPTPEEFAPMAGDWVGPIGGFLATFFFARWAARRASARPVAHGLAIGVGTALLDFSLGVLLSGAGAIVPLFFISNAGRIVAGLLGGWLGANRNMPDAQSSL
jgi:hypothetical protein